MTNTTKPHAALNYGSTAYGRYQYETGAAINSELGVAWRNLKFDRQWQRSHPERPSAVIIATESLHLVRLLCRLRKIARLGHP